jgi:hypothetical protein
MVPLTEQARHWTITYICAVVGFCFVEEKRESSDENSLESYNWFDVSIKHYAFTFRIVSKVVFVDC